MSEGGRAKPPDIREQPKTLARKIADHQGDPVHGAEGFAAMHAHKRQYVRGVEYRFSDGQHGEPPLANLAAQRGQPVREHVGREANARVQRAAEGDPRGGAQIPKGAGSPLPEGVRAKMEPKLGADLSGVRVHTGGESAAAAKTLGARAFTVGSDVHFNSGQFAPGSKEGNRLLAHELTHVVQGQKSGVQRKADGGAAGAAGPEVSKPEDAAEKEADAVADHVGAALDDEAGADDKPAAKGDHKADSKADKASKPVGEKAPSIGAKLEGSTIMLAPDGGSPPAGGGDAASPASAPSPLAALYVACGLPAPPTATPPPAGSGAGAPVPSGGTGTTPPPTPIPATPGGGAAPPQTGGAAGGGAGGAPAADGAADVPTLVTRLSADEKRQAAGDEALKRAIAEKTKENATQFAAVFITQFSLALDTAAQLLITVGAPNEVLIAFVNDPRFDAAAQKDLLGKADFSGKLSATTPIGDAFKALGANATMLAEVFKADPGGAKAWILKYPDKIKELLTANPAAIADWAGPLVTANQGALVLKMVNGAAEQWGAALQASGQLAALMSGAPSKTAIAQGSEEEKAVWALYPKATGVAGKRQIYDKLFNPNLDTAAGKRVYSRQYTRNTPAPPTLMDIEYEYTLVAIDEGMFDKFMEQLRQMPRSNVNTATGFVFTTGAQWREKPAAAPPAPAPPAPAPPPPAWGPWRPSAITTAMYSSFMNIVMMRLTWTDGRSTDMMNTMAADGAPRGVGAVPPAPPGGAAAGAPKALSFFQNHATHEVGHAVGCKPLDIKPGPGKDTSYNGKTGDDLSKSTGGWTEPGMAAFSGGAYWSGVDQNPAAPNAMRPNDARDYLLELVQKRVPTTVLHDNATGAPMMLAQPAAMAAIEAHFGNSNLYKYVKARGNGKGYMFPGFTPPDPVVFYNEGQGQVLSYKKELWDNRGSLSWYALSTHKEYFAEAYTAKFGGGPGAVPAQLAGFMDALVHAENEEFQPAGASTVGAFTPGAEGDAGGAGAAGAAPAAPAASGPEPALQSLIESANRPWP